MSDTSKERSCETCALQPWQCGKACSPGPRDEWIAPESCPSRPEFPDDADILVACEKCSQYVSLCLAHGRLCNPLSDIRETVDQEEGDKASKVHGESDREIINRVVEDTLWDTWGVEGESREKMLANRIRIAFEIRDRRDKCSGKKAEEAIDD